ncbi:MAG TPA: bifunctional RNase H/acid phosphatase [Egibacteraceae bacterium]|nr:bifunctional RNase H/acid phosphatase [Egibacteraceae bacterium]
MGGPARVVVEADGGSRGNPGPAGYGAVVRDAATGRVLAERAAGIGRATNNVAEYGGLIAGLQAARDIGADEVDVRMDSKLVVEQMSGRWKVKHPAMQPLHREASELRKAFSMVRFRWIPRAENSHADRLANEAMDAAARGETWQVDEADAWLAAHDSAAGPSAEPEPAASLHDAAPNRLSGWQEDPGPATTTLLLRHGQTAMSVEKRFSGVGDPELTEAGREMAAAAAVRLAGSGADAVVSSPLRRARQTAALVAEALGVEVQVEEGLRETDFGDWDGYTFAEVRQKWPAELDAWLASTAVAPPAGESFDATADRVRSALRRVQRAHAGRTVVVVSHVTPIKTLLRIALEAPPSALYRMHLDLVSLSEVQWFADGPAVVRSMNDTGHLRA